MLLEVPLRFATLHQALLQSIPPASEVTVPIIPLMASVAALAVGVAIVASAFIKPPDEAADTDQDKASARPKAKVTRRRRAAMEVEVEAPQPAAPAPLFKKAPFRVSFPGIPEGFPDVWGVDDPIDIAVHAEDKGIARLTKVPGLTVKVNDQPVTRALTRGVMKVRKKIPEKGEVSVQVDLKVKGESLPRRTTRKVRIVDYREEMAEVFAKFREEASRTIAPIPDDATPTDVVDILMDASPNLPVDTITTIVRGFEEAKFSNHAVTRESYERMIRALLDLEAVEL